MRLAAHDSICRAHGMSSHTGRLHRYRCCPRDAVLGQERSSNHLGVRGSPLELTNLLELVSDGTHEQRRKCALPGLPEALRCCCRRLQFPVQFCAVTLKPQVITGHLELLLTRVELFLPGLCCYYSGSGCYQIRSGFRGAEKEAVPPPAVAPPAVSSPSITERRGRGEGESKGEVHAQRYNTDRQKCTFA